MKAHANSNVIHLPIAKKFRGGHNVIPHEWHSIRKDKGKFISEKEKGTLWTIIRLSNYYQTYQIKIDYAFLIKQSGFHCSQSQMRRYLKGLQETKIINYMLVSEASNYEKSLIIEVNINALNAYIPSTFEEQVCTANLPTYNKNRIENKEENKSKSRFSESESEFLNFDSKVSEAKQTKSPKKTIKEFLPLTEDDRNYINEIAERDFSLCYMNKLFEKLALSNPDYSFDTKNLFMKYYAAKVIAKEKRTEKMVNKGVFNVNQDSDQYKIESYLTEVEESTDTSSLGILRKKIATQFPAATAYKILKNCYFHTDIIDGVYTLRPSKKLNLTQSDEDQLSGIIFSSLHRESLSGLVQRLSSESSTEHIVEKLDIIEPESDNSTSKPKKTQAGLLNLGEEGTLWNKISKMLLESFGEDLHKAWFSKLIGQEDAEKKTLKLVAPSAFICDWIKSDYNCFIQNCLNTERNNYRIDYETN